jgi:hypothetical protein
MKKMIAFCGLVCSDCGAFIATQKNDKELRKKVAEEWTKAYHADLKPEDINCDGCLSPTGKVFSYPQVCEIRACGKKQKVENCAYCSEYPCEKLNKFFELAPSARNTLEEIRKKRFKAGK